MPEQELSLLPWSQVQWYQADGEIVLFNPISGHTHLLDERLGPLLSNLEGLAKQGLWASRDDLAAWLTPYVDNAQTELACWLKLGLILESENSLLERSQSGSDEA